MLSQLALGITAWTNNATTIGGDSIDTLQPYRALDEDHNLVKWALIESDNGRASQATVLLGSAAAIYTIGAIGANLLVLNAADGLTWTPQPALVYTVAGALQASMFSTLAELSSEATFLQSLTAFARIDIAVIYFGALPLLLLAGGLAVDTYSFKKHLALFHSDKGPILLVAIAGTAINIALLVPIIFGGLKILSLFHLTPALMPRWVDATMMAVALAPTDPVTVVSLHRRRHDYFAALVEGESLLNDGVALVIFHVLGMMNSNKPLSEMAWRTTIIVFASPVVGLTSGYVTTKTVSILVPRDHPSSTDIVTPSLNILFVLVAYVLYTVCIVYLHLSGPLIVVTFGLAVAFTPTDPIVGQKLRSGITISASILESAVFALLGASLALKATGNGQESLALSEMYESWLLVAIILIALPVTRAAMVALLYRCIGLSFTPSVLFVFAGLRGVVSLIITTLIGSENDFGEGIYMPSPMKEIAVISLSLTILFNLLFGGLAYDVLSRKLGHYVSRWRSTYLRFTASRLDAEFEQQASSLIADLCIGSWLTGHDPANTPVERNALHSRGMERLLEAITVSMDEDNLRCFIQKTLHLVLSATPRFSTLNLSRRHLSKGDELVCTRRAVHRLRSEFTEAIHENQNEEIEYDVPSSSSKFELSDADWKKLDVTAIVDRYVLRYACIRSTYSKIWRRGLIDTDAYNALTDALEDAVEHLKENENCQSDCHPTPWFVEWERIRRHFGTHRNRRCPNTSFVNCCKHFHNPSLMFHRLTIVACYMEVHEAVLWRAGHGQDATEHHNLMLQYEHVYPQCVLNLLKLRDGCTRCFDNAIFRLLLENVLRLKLTLVERYSDEGRLFEEDTYVLKRLILRSLAQVRKLTHGHGLWSGVPSPLLPLSGDNTLHMKPKES